MILVEIHFKKNFTPLELGLGSSTESMGAA